MADIRLSKRELQVMEIFWKEMQILTASDIQNRLGLSANSVQSTVRRLLEKNIIAIDRELQKGRFLTRCYKSVLSKEDYTSRKVIRQFAALASDNISISSLTASFLATEKNPQKVLEEISELENILLQYKINQGENK